MQLLTCRQVQFHMLARLTEHLKQIRSGQLTQLGYFKIYLQKQGLAVVFQNQILINLHLKRLVNIAEHQ